jgi:predicted phosphoribosyltransferase
VGLLSGLLTLPLAPVRGTVWVAEQIAAQAERELGDETALRRRLAEAEREFELGALTVEEYEAIEDELLERIELLREARRQEEEEEVT